MDGLRRDFEQWLRKFKGRSARPGEFLESYVTYMYHSLLVRHAENIRVTQGAKVPDKRGNTYNIDVFFEFDVAGVQHRVAIECKDHKRPVTRDDVLAFHGKINDMPSTIGVYISLSGFQQGAEQYLKDHGIKYYDGDTLPGLGSTIASWFQPVALPDDTAVGQPFWTVMDAKDGQPTGSWLLINVTGANPSSQGYEKAAIPLFISRPEALRYQRLVHSDAGSSCVRGLEQPALRVIISLAELQGLRFATMAPIEIDGRQGYQCSVWTPQALADEFIVVGDFSDAPGARDPEGQHDDQ